jgi:type IV pilus assembly protein PilM
MPPSLKLKLGRRTGPDLVGLDIQPGVAAAVQASVNGSILAQRAAVIPLAADLVREGEVADVEALGDALRELFDASGLGKRVRIGVANQRTVMRTIELPPVTDHKELAAAVRFQAEDQVPMPLNNAVLDFHPLGIVDTPAGPRQRVVLVAAQRDMIERLCAAVRHAGLRPDGVDLSAFALIRALYRRDDAHAGRVLYLNVDGLTNLAIAEGSVCRFTRVVGGGLEAMASELAERRGIALTEARELLAAVDLTAPAAVEPDLPALELSPSVETASVPDAAAEPAAEVPIAEIPGVVPDTDATGAEKLGDETAEDLQTSEAVQTPEDQSPGAEAPYLDTADPGKPFPDAPGPDSLTDAAPGAEELHGDVPDVVTPDPAVSDSVEGHEEREAAMSYSETIFALPPEVPVQAISDADVRLVLENGIREISGEVRNSLEFHRTQEDGGEVSHVALSGSALDIPGFAAALQVSLGVEVHAESIGLANAGLEQEVAVHRLAVAAGLTAIEVAQ